MGKAIVVLVSICLAVATELIPFADAQDETSKRQKHFWAFILFVLSMVVGFPIENAYTMETKINELEEIVKGHAHDSVARGKFEGLDTLYHHNFDGVDPALTEWANELLGYLDERWSHGIMPLPREQAATQLAKIYPHARESIIATNVGSTDFYFSSRTYSLNNQRTGDHGIPIVRFYLYSNNGERIIKIRRGKGKPTFAEFCKEVGELNTYLHSMYSVGVNVDKFSMDTNRDLLLMDNKLLAETLETDSWQPIRAEASQNPIQLTGARQYFSELWGRVGIEENNTEAEAVCKKPMSDDDVRRAFKNHKLLPVISKRGHLAEDFVQALIDRMAYSGEEFARK